MGKKQIRKALEIFTARAKKELQAEQVILFGSYAKDAATEYSDVDVAVLSNVFSHIPQEERLDVLYPLTADLSPDFHPFGFTPEEFAKARKTSTLFEIKTNGIPL